MNAWMGLVPLGFLAAAGLVVMLLDAFSGRRAELGLWTFVVLALSAAFPSLLLTASNVPALPDMVSGYIAADRLGLFFDVVVCVGAALSALLAAGYLNEHALERGEFYVLLIYSTLGAMVLARATDLLTLFVGLETMSLAVYALAAFRRTSARAVESALKYFLLGSFAAAILLFGSALLYGATGHTHLVAIGNAITQGKADEALTLLALAMIVVGLIFKVSAVPFHMWTPDAYEGAATPVTTFMSVVVKAAAFAVLARVLVSVFGAELFLNTATGWVWFLVAISAITMVYGNLAAIAQSSVKRMLAYSSIAHAGYVLVPLSAYFAQKEAALSAVFYYLLAYAVSNVLAFGSLIWLGSRGKEAVSYADISGAGRRHPVVGLAFTIGVLSLMGFPPTAGFFAKYYAFSAAVAAGGWMIALAVLGILTSAIGAYYYLKVVVYLFMREPEEDAPFAVPMRSGYVASAVAIAAILVLWFGLAPSNYIEMARSAAAGLIG